MPTPASAPAAATVEGAVPPAEVHALRGDPNPGLLRGTLHALYDATWLTAAVLGLPWILWKNRRTPGFGRMVLEQLGRGLPRLDPPARGRILIHGVSVGEVKGALPLVRGLTERWPGAEIVLSTTTGTGLDVARSLFRGHTVVRFPADVSFVVRRFLDRLHPTFVILVELEIWPNFLRECNRRGLPVAVVNGRITGRSHARYLAFRKLLPQFNRISFFCVQSQEYAERFRALEVDPARILITGNVKADGLRSGAVEPGEELRRLLGAPDGRLVLVAGSTHEPEEGIVARAWRAGAPETRLVLVPRHPQRCEDVARTLAALGMPAQRLSALRRGEAPDPRRPAIVDTIGELERVYGLADLVFVGGSLIPHGGQNMLEAAAQGKAVLFGPHVRNFAQEAALLLSRGACRQVADEAELARALRELAADPGLRGEMAAAGRAVVEGQKGATELTLRALERLVPAG